MRSEHPNTGPDATRAVNAEARENAWRALELRKTGQTYRQIASRLQCSLGAAHKYVTSALAELRSEVIDSARDLRDLEVTKLDDLEHRLRKRLKPECSDSDCAKLATAILKITESRRKLLGLDAPQRIEHRGNLYTVKEASPECSAWDAPAPAAPVA